MNEINRQKVLDYINNKNFVDSVSPLYFKGYDSPVEEFDPTKYSVESMVERTIKLARMYISYDSKDKYFECSIGANRSSLDIWRHILYYYPDVSIFDVMHTLFTLNESKQIWGFFCTDINRRVFILGHTVSDFQRNFRLCLYGERSITNQDEYNLIWDDWKDI